ncbi:hypothetical protein [Anaerosacchariphilus polymeriproducens]|nr:hypothetical protein [Anaerosacchariphilus polymeriproducens]
MKNKKEKRNDQTTYIIEREYLGKYSVEEFVKRVIKSHINFPKSDCH